MSLRPRSRVRRTGAALAGAALLLSATSCGDDAEPSAGSTTSAPAAPSSATTSTPASTSPTTTTPPDAGDAAVIPVYYVGDTPDGDRLFREFTQAAGVDPLVAAGSALTQGDPVDPDYRTAWPSGRFASVEQTDDAIVVELPDDTWTRRGSLDAGRARLATQQLAYTLQGVVGERLPIEVRVDGARVDRLLGVDVSRGLTAAPQLRVLAFVNVTEPAEGTAVSGSFTATGRASSFEATVTWVIEDAAGTVVLEGFAMADGWLDRLHPWETTIDVSSLPPGEYTFIARTDDPSDGEGPGATEDTKRILVE